MDKSMIFTYVFSFVVTSMMLIMPSLYVKLGARIQLIKRLYILAGVTALCLIFNFSYTAYLGFNHTPNTMLELVLDLVTGVIQLIAIVAFFYTCDVIRREKQQQQKI